MSLDGNHELCLKRTAAGAMMLMVLLTVLLMVLLEVLLMVLFTVLLTVLWMILLGKPSFQLLD